MSDDLELVLPDPEPPQPQQVQIVTCGHCQKPLVQVIVLNAVTKEPAAVFWCQGQQCPANPLRSQVAASGNGSVVLPPGFLREIRGDRRN